MQKEPSSFLSSLRQYLDWAESEEIDAVLDSAFSGDPVAEYILGCALEGRYPEVAQECFKDSADKGYAPATKKLFPIH